MRLWLVLRTNGCDYDEYDGAVVREETEESALSLACDELVGFAGDRENISVTEILFDGEPGLVLTSFRAG